MIGRPDLAAAVNRTGELAVLPGTGEHTVIPVVVAAQLDGLGVGVGVGVGDGDGLGLGLGVGVGDGLGLGAPVNASVMLAAVAADPG